MTSVLIRFLVACSSLVFASGCFFIVPPAQGDLLFSWSFNGEERCVNAGVDQVDVIVLDSTNQQVFGDTYTCTNDDILIPDLDVGRHTVVLKAYGFNNEKLFEGQQSATVESNLTIDMGFIVLDRVQLGPLDGEVIFNWGFIYPTSDVENNCARAGVDFVDVRLTPTAANTSGQVFEQTFSCNNTSAGAAITTSEGDYELTIDAYQSGSPDLLLYESNVIEVVIINDDPLDLGNVELYRIEASFGDISVDWSLPQSCAELGISTVDFSIFRTATNTEELSFSVSCDAAQQELIEVVVPGNYSIEASATGSADLYFGLKTFTVAPNAVNDVTVDLSVAN